MFSTLSKRNFCGFATFSLPSTNAFNLDQSKILSFGRVKQVDKYKSMLSACLTQPNCMLYACYMQSDLYRLQKLNVLSMAQEGLNEFGYIKTNLTTIEATA